ncbi:MAG: hypothetical protein K8I82_11015, partial [Anaerolineae bacterium]|nr:hypothetical protein [Anaerolineae bacterium]
MVSKFFKLLMLLTLVPTSLVFASQPGQENPPVTSYFTSETNVSTLDPAKAEDNLSVNWIENLFLGLTNNNPLNNIDIQPELASSYEITDGGKTWTFKIRTDVPWVRYNPATEEAEIIDYVSASDMEWSIKRACDPRLGSRYSSIIAGVIAGCDVLNSSDPADITDEMVWGDTVKVSAPDEETLV